jgi:hypothetical protein
MKTRSIDLAAYLHICGVEPESITMDPKYHKREFTYLPSDMLTSAVEAFNRDAMVPVRAFSEARALMKSKPHDRKVGNFRKAQQSARSTVHRREL